MKWPKSGVDVDLMCSNSALLKDDVNINQKQGNLHNGDVIRSDNLRKGHELGYVSDRTSQPGFGWSTTE